MLQISTHPSPKCLSARVGGSITHKLPAQRDALVVDRWEQVRKGISEIMQQAELQSLKREKLFCHPNRIVRPIYRTTSCNRSSAKSSSATSVLRRYWAHFPVAIAQARGASNSFCCGSHGHPITAYLKAFLLRIKEGLIYAKQLRDF